MKSENFNRRNFLRLGATGIVSLGVTKTALAQNGKNEDDKLLKTSGLTRDITDHGSLGGLADDDHPQYLNNQRADARYAGLNTAGKVNPKQVGNFTAPRNGQSLQLRDGAIINVSETYRRLDTEFGVVADGVTNNAAAIQTALNALRDSNGGTLVFPDGVTKISGSSNINQTGKFGAIRLLGSGGNSAVHIAGGGRCFEFANTSSVTVEELTFIGTPGNYVFDFTQALFYFSYVEQVTIRNCQFLGLSVNAPYSGPPFEINKDYGIVVCNQGDLLIDRCIFGGCATNQCPNVGVTSWNGLTIRDSQFLDYGAYANNTLISKTGGITNTAWVRALNYNPVTSARQRGKISIERTTFDEAHSNALYLYGAKWLELNNVSINCSPIGVSIFLRDIWRAKIKDSFIGYNNNMDVGVFAYDCSLIEMENLVLDGSVKYINISGATQKLISRYSNLPGGSLAANGVINDSGASVEIIN